MKSIHLNVRALGASACALSLLLALFVPLKLQAAELVLNGVALHQELNSDYFLAGLYLPVVSNDTAEIFALKGQKRMEMRVTFDNFSPRKFAGLWRDSIVINNSPADIDKFGPDILKFASVMKGKLVRGDQVHIDQLPLATVVSVNGIELARFSTDFFPLLLRTWIGPRPASSDFKKDLLAKGNVKEEFRTRYNSLVPLDGRNQLATLWGTGTSAPDADAAAAAKAAEESRLQSEAEAKARVEAEALARAEAKARAEAEVRAQAEAKARAEMQLKIQAEAKARSEAESKARAEAAAAAKAAEEAIKTASDATAKAAAEAKAKAMEVTRQRAEAERAQAEAKARAEEEARVAAEVKAKLEAQARADAAAKAKAEADARAVAAVKAEEDARKRAADIAARQLAAASATATTVAKSVDEDNQAVEFDPAQAARELYKAKLVAWVYKSLEYPEKDKRARKEGSLQAKVTINRDGSLASTELLEETRYATLNVAAKNATKLAQPYPPIPKDIDGKTFEFIVPILFRAE